MRKAKSPCAESPKGPAYVGNRPGCGGQAYVHARGMGEPGRGGAGDAPEDRTKERVHQPMGRESPTEAPDSPPLAIRLPPPSSSFDEICVPTRAPASDSGCLDHLSNDKLRNLRTQHGNSPEGTRAVLETRVASTQDQAASSTQNLPMDANTQVTGTGKRDCPPTDVVENAQGPRLRQISVVGGVLCARPLFRTRKW